MQVELKVNGKTVQVEIPEEQLKELDQINDRYKVCLDEGILSGAIRRDEEIHRERSLAYQWSQLGCH